MDASTLMFELPKFTEALLRRKENELKELIPSHYITWTYPNNFPKDCFITLEIADNPLLLEETCRPFLLEHIFATISSLEKNWDGYNAEKPNSDIINIAIGFLSKLPNQFVESLDENNIFPNPNGTISIEWRKEKNLLSLEIGKDSATFFTRINGEYSGEDNIKTIDKEVPQSIIRAIKAI